MKNKRFIWGTLIVIELVILYFLPFTITDKFMLLIPFIGSIIFCLLLMQLFAGYISLSEFFQKNEKVNDKLPGSSIFFSIIFSIILFFYFFIRYGNNTEAELKNNGISVNGIVIDKRDKYLYKLHDRIYYVTYKYNCGGKDYIKEEGLNFDLYYKIDIGDTILLTVSEKDNTISEYDLTLKRD